MTLLYTKRTTDNNGSTPLHATVIGRRREAIAFLISAGADIYAQNTDGATPLLLAKENGYEEIVQLLELCSQQEVREYLKDPQDFVNKHGIGFIFDQKQTVLMLACIFGHTHIISLFRDKPSKCLCAKDYYNCSAFNYAVLFNLDSVAHFIHIFSHKVKITLSPTSSLMEQGIKKGNLTLVNALLSIGAKPTLELAQQVSLS